MLPTSTTTRGTSGWSRAGPSPNVGSTDAMAASSRPLAIFSATNARSLARPPRRAAPTVEPSSPGPPQGTATCCTKNASRRGSLRRARHEQSQGQMKKKRQKRKTTTKPEMVACMIPGTLSQSFCAYFEGYKLPFHRDFTQLIRFAPTTNDIIHQDGIPGSGQTRASHHLGRHGSTTRE